MITLNNKSARIKSWDCYLREMPARFKRENDLIDQLAKAHGKNVADWLKSKDKPAN